MGWVHYLNKSPTRLALLRGEPPHWVRNSPRSKYIAAVILSAPPWLDIKDILILHFWAKAMTAMHGKPYVLDHVVPLNHPHVCGLTVPWNVRVVPWRVNACKGAKFNPEQLELL